MEPASDIFFARSYTYRKPGALIAGLVAAGFGGFALGYLMLAMSHAEWSIKALAAVVFVGGIGGLLAWTGAWLIRQWFRRTHLLLEISAPGIRYGDAFHPWERVGWIAGHADKQGIQLFYQTRGRGLVSRDRPLPVDPALTRDEYSDLMEALRMRLSRDHPEVTFGS